MSKVIKIGSRESKLAIVQTEIICSKIKEKFPQYDTEIITMKTTGDKILEKRLDKIGGKGLFVKELDHALKSGIVDMTVHSLKDIPMDIDDDIPISAYSERISPYDVIVYPKERTNFDSTKPIGTSSIRREIQYKRLFPDANIKPVRGNIQTRLSKLDSGEYSALILAEASFLRLGIADREYKVLSEEDMIPAAGQGIIALQTRKGEFTEITKDIDDSKSRIEAEAERAFVKALNGGCSSPIAAFANVSGNKLTLKGFYANKNISIIKSIEGDANNASSLGINLASLIKEKMK